MLLRNSTNLSQEDFDLAWYVARTVVFGQTYPNIEKVFIRNNSRDKLSGHIKLNKQEIVISIPSDIYFPRIEALRTTSPIYVLNNKLEALTAVLSHELHHLFIHLAFLEKAKKENREPKIRKLSDIHSETDCEKFAVSALSKLQIAPVSLTSTEKLDFIKLIDRVRIKHKVEVLSWDQPDKCDWLTVKKITDSKHVKTH